MIRELKVGDKVRIKDLESISDSFIGQVGIVIDLVSTGAADYASIELKEIGERYGKYNFHFRLTSIELVKNKLYMYGI